MAADREYDRREVGRLCWWCSAALMAVLGLAGGGTGAAAVTTVPDTAIVSRPPDATQSTSAVFEFNSTVPGATFTCQLDGGSLGACSSPQSYSNLSEGTHTFSVAATDPATNETDPTPASATWVVDHTPPAPFDLVSPPAGGWAYALPTYEWQ